MLRAVIGRAKVDRILVNAVDEKAGNLRQPRLGIAHGGRIIAVDITEIALSVDQWITLGEILRQAHEGIVDSLVTVRMEFADDIADDAGTFLERGTRVKAQLLHGVKQPPVDRLQSIARIRQRPVHDRRKRVSEIALLQRIAQHDLVDFGRLRRNQCFSHGKGLDF